MKTTIRTAVTGAALAGILATAGCSVGNLEEVEPSAEQTAAEEAPAEETPEETPEEPADDAAAPALTTVEAGNVSVDVLEGMEPYDAPEGYVGFWQTPEGAAPQVTVGVAADPADTFVADQLEQMSGVMTDLEVLSQDDYQATFTGTGVDGQTYTGIASNNITAGVMVSSGEGIDEATLEEIAASAL